MGRDERWHGTTWEILPPSSYTSAANVKVLRGTLGGDTCNIFVDAPHFLYPERVVAFAEIALQQMISHHSQTHHTGGRRSALRFR